VHRRFLAHLVDPASKEPLALEDALLEGDDVRGGVLASSRGRYPIVDGIPRFVGGGASWATRAPSRSFDVQWARWRRLQFESENAGRPMEGHTKDMWERVCGLRDHPANLRGRLVADVGCGAGRFVEQARSRGAEVIAIDHGRSVEVAAQSFRGDDAACFVQADALQLPLREGALDGAYSIGVLHHTGDPRRGVLEAARALAPGGWLAVAVYHRRGYYDLPSVQAWRRLFAWAWPVTGPWPALLYTHAVVGALWPISRLAPRLALASLLVTPWVPLADIRWSLLDTFDSITPSHQSTHETYEVFRWFRDAGLTDVEPTDWGFTTFRGHRPSGGRHEPRTGRASTGTS
jgi:SAM-dependent methyltransferase